MNEILFKIYKRIIKVFVKILTLMDETWLSANRLGLAIGSIGRIPGAPLFR